MTFRVVLITLMVWSLLGCSESPLDPNDEPSSSEPSFTPVTHWCDAALGGLGEDREKAAALARAHVGHRLFGPMGDWLALDTTLVGILAEISDFNDGVMDAYAAALPTFCSIPSSIPSTEETVVALEEGRAVILPGQTIPELPEGTQEVVIDLRNAPPDAPLKEIIALAFSETLQLGNKSLKIFHGFPAQNSDWTHYEIEKISQIISLEGSGSTNLPLTFWTGPTLSPQAAQWAGGLRLAGYAALVGYDVYTQVAESTWTGHQEGGFLWRSSLLQSQGVDWPDIIPADIPTATPEKDFQGRTSIDLSGALQGDATRAPLADYDRALGEPEAALSHGVMRAALLVAYGTLDWFYPFFDLVGRDIDAALEQGLEEIKETSGTNRKEMKQILGRFMHSIHDGHGFYADWANEDWSDGYLDIQIQEINGLPVVRTSAEQEIDAGDTIVAIDGIPAADWYAEATTRYSAASDWYRFVLATDELKEVYGTKELTLKDTTGNERTITAQPTSWLNEASVAWGGGIERKWLAGVGRNTQYLLYQYVRERDARHYRDHREV